MTLNCSVGDDPEKDAGEPVLDPWDDIDQPEGDNDDGGVGSGPVSGESPD